MILGEFDYLALKVLRAHDGKWQRSGDLIRAVQARDPSVYAKKVRRAFEKLERHSLAERRGEDSNREWRATSAGSVNKHALRPPLDLAVALLKLRQLAGTHVPTTVSHGLADYFKGSVDVLGQNEGGSQQAAARAWLEKTIRLEVGYPLLAPKIHADVLDTVLDALYRDTCVSLVYQNGRTSTTEPAHFNVLPLALVEKGPVLYLVADRPRTRGGVKRHLLRVDRILEASACDTLLVRDASFHLDAYVRQEKVFEFFSEPPVEIVLRVREQSGIRSPFRELRFAEDQSIVDEEGGFRLTAKVTPSVALTNLLLERAETVEVIAPQALRVDIVDRLRRALTYYADASETNQGTMKKSGHG